MSSCGCRQVPISYTGLAASEKGVGFEDALWLRCNFVSPASFSSSNMHFPLVEHFQNGPSLVTLQRIKLVFPAEFVVDAGIQRPKKRAYLGLPWRAIYASMSRTMVILARWIILPVSSTPWPYQFDTVFRLYRLEVTWRLTWREIKLSARVGDKDHLSTLKPLSL